MNTSISLPQNFNSDDKRPLPLIVADKWQFPLQHHVVEGIYFYAAHEWIAGLTNNPTKKAAEAWRNTFKNRLVSNPPLELPYTFKNGKRYLRDFITDHDLYIVAQNLRATHNRESLTEIKKYLAAMGAFGDKLRRDPKLRAAVGATAGAEAVIDATIERYEKIGRENSWIHARLEGAVTRKQFMSALRAAVLYASDNLYRNGTEKVYNGLWKRTTAQLRSELSMPQKGGSVRDKFGEYALIYTRLAEKVATDKLRHAEIVTEPLAMEIIFEAAKIIHQQAEATAQALGIDLVTEKPLLPDKTDITREEFRRVLEKVSRPNKNQSDVNHK